MPIKARIFAYSTITLGLGALTLSLSAWKNDNLLQFCFYLVFAALSSQMKVRMPGVNGTMSVNFVFTLLAVTSLDPGKSVIVCVTGALTQLLWNSKSKLKPIHVMFNAASSAISCGFAYLVFHSEPLRLINSTFPIMVFWTTIGFFVCNTASVATIAALSLEKPVLKLWRENYFWTAPQYLFGALMTWMIHTLVGVVGWEVSVLVLPGVFFVDRSYRLYLGRLEQEQQHVSQMADLHLRTIKSLALAINAKDVTTHDHLRRVQVYAQEIAKELNVTEEVMQALQAAALLHDIGKLAVPEYIISKPGRLTPEEFEKMKIHPVVGAEILESVKFPYPVVPIVRHHHEKWDGSGYPDGIKGEEIPIGARILTAVDCLDAMASDRQYRRAMPLDEAMGVIIAESGKMFDPKVVEVLRRRYRDLEKMAKETLVEENYLSTEVKVERGEAPAAGFEATEGAPTGEKKPAQADFITSIAAARQEIQTLFEVTQDLGSTLSLDDTFSLLATRMKTVVPHDCIAFYLTKDEKLMPQFVQGTDSKLFASLEIPMGQGLSGWVAENHRPIINGNPSVEPGYLNDSKKFSTLRSAISIPLHGAGSVIGSMTLYHAENDAFSRDHLRVLLAIGSKCGIAIENSLKFKNEQKTASTDSLTGLPNARSLFLHLDSELNRSETVNESLAVLVLDLDGFKSVNDRFGHLEGNKLLQMIANGLKIHLRPKDYVARMGGDEFVIVLPNVPNEVVRERIEQLASMVVEQGQILTGEKVVNLSVGQANYPGDGTKAEEILAEADRRMYAMKETHHSMRRSLIALQESTSDKKQETAVKEPIPEH